MKFSTHKIAEIQDFNKRIFIKEQKLFEVFRKETQTKQQQTVCIVIALLYRFPRLYFEK